jgi:hypothetical protein
MIISYGFVLFQHGGHILNKFAFLNFKRRKIYIKLINYEFSIYFRPRLMFLKKPAKSGTVKFNNRPLSILTITDIFFV